MARVHVFADEAGDLGFSAKAGASKYFIVTTIAMTDCTVGDELLRLRRQMAWEGIEFGTDDFHATEERQEIRDQVFAVLNQSEFRVDATIFEKRKTRPHLQANDVRFYKAAWFIHFKYVARQLLAIDDELLVVAASLGTRNRKAMFHAAVLDVVQQASPTTAFRTVAWHGASDPCLWAADFCCWAIQRKWERGDMRSYQLIQHKIKSEFEAFRFGRTMYY